MDIIYCAGGGKVLAEIAIQEGFLYGARSDDVREIPRCNGLIDINWKNYDWGKHLAAVRSHRPKYAVVPDVEDRRNIKKILEMASSLEDCCRHVIVVPKHSGIIASVPERFIIGISVPTSYSGFIPSSTELRGRLIHLLGGSPGQQKALWQYYRLLGIRVTSVDVNCHNKVSNFGKYWDGRKWAYEGNHEIDKYEAFRRSCRGILKMWREVGALPQKKNRRAKM